MKSRLRAFTIMEIVVTIAITAILVTLVFNAINFLSAQNYREMRTKDRINEWMILRKQMIQDVYLSNSLERIDQGMRLTIAEKNITYVTRNDRLLIEKNGNVIETSFDKVSCEWIVNHNNQETCQWSINLLDEVMVLDFLSFSTTASRINQWYQNRNKSNE